MISKYFADKLREIQVDTPLTNRFDEKGGLLIGK